MADITTTQTVEYHWEKIGTLPAGTRLRVILNESNVIHDATVPAGKKLRGRIAIDGDILIQ